MLKRRVAFKAVTETSVGEKEDSQKKVKMSSEFSKRFTLFRRKYPLAYRVSIGTVEVLLCKDNINKGGNAHLSSLCQFIGKGRLFFVSRKKEEHGNRSIY